MVAARPRYALFNNGSRLARLVVHNLLDAGRVPTCLVEPGYPPASPPPAAIFSAESESFDRPLLSEIPRLHAPPTEQDQCAQSIQACDIDFILVVCWPYLLAPVIIDSARQLTLNLHPSLLPAFRGPDPIGAQLAGNDARLGVSLHLLSQGFDEGDVLLRSTLREPLARRNRGSLEDACARLGSQLFIDVLDGYDSSWKAVPQQELEAVSDNAIS